MADTPDPPTPSLAQWGWQITAACRGMGASLFFAPSEESPEDRQTRLERAKVICRECRAVDQCREFAIRTREPYGVWGGLSEAERAKLLGVRNLRYSGERMGGIHESRALFPRTGRPTGTDLMKPTPDLRHCDRNAR